MRAVIDTNVLVSALINGDGRPGQVVARVRTLELMPVVSDEILIEYVAVLRRARFDFAHDAVNELLEDIRALALNITPARMSASGLPDPDDAIFMAVAKAAGCPVVTGNARHFPVEAGVEILSPAECIERLLKA